MVSGYTPGQNASSASTVKFNQVVRGDVKISKTGDKKYKIKFTKEREFTLYQVWTPNGDNSERLVLTDSSKQWQERIIAEQKATGFAPTTLMAVGDCKWAFVITNAYFEKSCLVLEVSTAEIVNLSKTVQQGLKTGFFKNARFDIDNVSSTKKYKAYQVTIKSNIKSNCSEFVSTMETGGSCGVLGRCSKVQSQNNPVKYVASFIEYTMTECNKIGAQILPSTVFTAEEQYYLKKEAPLLEFYQSGSKKGQLIQNT